MVADLQTRTLVHNLLDGLGVHAADLQAALTLPTIAEFLPRVFEAATPAMRRTYGPYWTKAEDRFGSRMLDELQPSDIGAFRQQAITSARRRRNSRDGRYAGESAVRAMRVIYRLAVADGLIRPDHNPASTVKFPRRTRSTRRGLSREEVADLNLAIRTSGNDPVLDSLLLRLHLETAAGATVHSGSASKTLTPRTAASCYGRRAAPSDGSRSPRPWLRRWLIMPAAAVRADPPTPCCGIATVSLLPHVDTTACGCVSEACCRGPTNLGSLPIGCATPR